MDGSGDLSALRPPKTLLDPLEFLSLSWSVSPLHLYNAVSPLSTGESIAENIAGEDDGESVVPLSPTIFENSLPFASSATSQLVFQRIMPQEVSPLSSARPSHSSGPLSGSFLTDSPPISLSDLDDIKYIQSETSTAKAHHRWSDGGSARTVGSWLKDRRERKKAAARAHDARLNAAVSVAGVASAMAAMAVDKAALSRNLCRDERSAQMNLAVASAAMLVAAQCVDAAEFMGAGRDQLATVVGSAVGIRKAGDLAALTAAATADLREAATPRASRTSREPWNISEVIRAEKGGGDCVLHHLLQKCPAKSGENGSGVTESRYNDGNFLGICSQEVLARGAQLLKRTRKGNLHWKIVSVYITKNQVILKMKSKYIAGTITKSKKYMVVGVCKKVVAWPGRPLHGEEKRSYFGVRIAEGRVIEFECRTEREYEIWTQGIAYLLDISKEGKSPGILKNH